MIRTLPLLILLALSTSACDQVDDYFSVMAAEGILLGIEDAPAEVDFELGSAVTASAFLAEARSLDSFSANLIDDADQVTIARGDVAVEMESAGSGLYEADSSVDDSLTYTAGVLYTLRVVAGGASTVSIQAPEAPELVGAPDPQDFHPAGQPITIDLTGQGFVNYVALVGTADAQGNVELTYDNRPQTADDYIDWFRGSDDVTVVTIPGTAFPDSGTPYVLGVAGIDRAPDSAFDGLNPLVSNFAAGTVATALVATSP
jgi:hypothetical protein